MSDDYLSALDMINARYSLSGLVTTIICARDSLWAKLFEPAFQPNFRLAICFGIGRKVAADTIPDVRNTPVNFRSHMIHNFFKISSSIAREALEIVL